MPDMRPDRDLDRRLATWGSDLSRWPDRAGEAREALLAQPEFRGAFERERELDRRLAAHRDLLDAEIARSGATGRLARISKRPYPAGFLADVPWRRVAAGVLIACMLGGAIDLMLPEPAPDLLDVALVDPLAGFDLGSR